MVGTMSERGSPAPAAAQAADGAGGGTEAGLTRAVDGLGDGPVRTVVLPLGTRYDALDAAQEACSKCWRARASLGGVQNLRAWIFRVGLNAAKDLQRSAWSRRAKPFMGEETMLVGREVAPGQLLEDQEALDRLRQALLGLRREEQEVFLLRQNGGLTYEQIAEVRNSPVGTVKTQMRSALQKLRKVLN